MLWYQALDRPNAIALNVYLGKPRPRVGGFAERGTADDAPLDPRPDLRSLVQVLRPLMSPAEALEVARAILERRGSFMGAVVGDKLDFDPRAAAVLEGIRAGMQRLTEISKDRRRKLTRKTIVGFLRAHLLAQDVEKLCVLFADRHNRFLGMLEQRGTVDDVPDHLVREFASRAFQLGAQRCYIGRTRATGQAWMTYQEAENARWLRRALAGIDVTLVDYLIVSPTDIASYDSIPQDGRTIGLHHARRFAESTTERSLTHRLGGIIEQLVDILDELTADPDLEPDADAEPWLAGTYHLTTRANPDLEADSTVASS